MADGAGVTRPERIETLIPYREPAWRPLRRPPTLKDSDSSWASLGKLGRYLLSGSGDDGARLGAVALSAYASVLADDPASVRPLAGEAPGELEAYMLDRAGGDPILLRDGETLVALCTTNPRSGKWLGEHEWYMRNSRAGGTAKIRCLKLPALVGAAALLGSVPESELRRRAAEVLESSLRFLESYVDRERETASSGSLKAAARRREKLTTELEEIAMAPGIPPALQRAVSDSLAEEKWGEFDHYFRGLRLELSSAFMREEGERDLNRRYTDMSERGASATVWTDKRNLDPAHVAAASSGFIGRSFSHVEIDDEVDLDVYARMQGEFEARFAARELPRVDPGTLRLRFRKCGRHRASGIYSPLLATVVVDPRSPSSLLHEFAHAYDFAHGQLSCSRAFRPVLESFRSRLDALLEESPTALRGVGHGGYSYAVTPTEVFARAWEVWAATNGRGGSFVKEADAYREGALYAPLLEDAALVSEYFESALPEADLPLPLEPGCWERAACDHGAWEASGPGASIDPAEWDAAPAGAQFRLFDPVEGGIER